jgi:hypothetical protein
VLGGVLVGLVPGGQAVLLCAGGIAAVTVLVTASPTLRAFPASPRPPEPPAAASTWDQPGSHDERRPRDGRERQVRGAS